MATNKPVATFVLAALLLSGNSLRAQSQDFESPLPAGWEPGTATADHALAHSGQQSLRVPPGTVASWKLRDNDGAGKVEMWIYEDGTAPADAKTRRNGPRWGLRSANGRVLVIGALYARYLAGDTTYAIADSDGKDWGTVQYSALKRLKGWHLWTFDFDPVNGLSILCDGKKARFDWNRTQFKGFNSLVIYGDSGPEPRQTIWVDDVGVNLGGTVQSEPKPPPPPPDVVPLTDPAPEKAVKIVPALRGQHPRLVFSPPELAEIKQFAAGPGTEVWRRVVQYAGAAKPPADLKFASDDTEAQRQGFWRLPTLALQAAISGEPAALARTKAFMQVLLETDHWQTGQEQDSGMGAANMLAGAALAYDWSYNSLDPGFRAQFREKLILQARRLYYRGHLKRGNAITYWQNDAANNHRWHRDAGLALAVLAATEDDGRTDWLLAELDRELNFIASELPPDGSTHESPSYMVFGMPYLVLAMQSADRCLGTKHLDAPFFQHAADYRLATLTPGFEGTFNYGDSAGFGGINNYLYATTAHFKQADALAAMEQFAAKQPDAFQFAWFSLVWIDPSLQPGSITQLPLNHYFPDMGMAMVRDGWDLQNVALMFKCAPYGGVKLNEFRRQNNNAYINIAHDDPDANMFQLYAAGGMLAEDDRYAHYKITAAHNTILVNGRGQKGEGGQWTQPLKGADADMSKLAYLTDYRTGEGFMTIEGEAGPSYVGLDRYRRRTLWLAGQYVLVLDDIQAPRSAEITWLLQSPELSPIDPPALQFQMRNGTSRCDFQMASDANWVSEIVASPAENRGKSLGFQQLRLTTSAASVRSATVFDPWHRHLDASFKKISGQEAQISLRGDGVNDTWLWTSAPSTKEPSVITKLKP